MRNTFGRRNSLYTLFQYLFLPNQPYSGWITKTISGTLVAIFGPILSLGYMSLFKYLYQRYETHPILKVWKMPAKYLLPFTLVKVSLVHSSSIVTV